jgi:hypothetical protein
MLRANTESCPIYKTIGIPEIDENPLTAHLRLPPENDRDAFLALGLQANFNPSEREFSTSVRRLRVNGLRRFFIPALPVHRRALIGISSQMFDSYCARNPMTPEGQAVLYGGPIATPYRATISFVAGHSGMGKSTLIDRILSYSGNQVYRHTTFRGENFPETQILWLRRNVPEQCTLAILCSTFGDHTDTVLHIKQYGGIFRRRNADRSQYINEIRKIVANHHVGLLVLDEFQNLSLMGIGAQKIIALLVNLRDELGVPIVVIGTYKALRLLEGTMSSARRLCEGGYFDLARPLSHEDEAWQLLCSAAWEYQWVRDPVDLTPEISDALYDVSQGISGIMLSVLATAQLAAMEGGSPETVDSTLIRKVYDERMKPLHPAIRLLESGDPRQLDKFDDLYLNTYPTIRCNEDGTHAINSSNDLQNPSAPETLLSSSTTDNSPKSKSSKQSPSETTRPAILTEDQIRNLVTADSMRDLVSILDRS